MGNYSFILPKKLKGGLIFGWQLSLILGRSLGEIFGPVLCEGLMMVCFGRATAQVGVSPLTGGWGPTPHLLLY